MARKLVGVASPELELVLLKVPRRLVEPVPFKFSAASCDSVRLRILPAGEALTEFCLLLDLLALLVVDGKPDEVVLVLSSTGKREGGSVVLAATGADRFGISGKGTISVGS